MSTAHIEFLIPPIRAGSVINNRDQTKERIGDALDQIRDRGDMWWKDSEFRFLYISGQAIAQDNYAFGIGGLWLANTSITHLRSANTERTGTFAFDYSQESIHAGVYDLKDEVRPEPNTWGRARLRGSQLQTISVSVLTVLESIGAIIVLLLVVFSALGRMRLQVPSRYKIIVIFVSTCVLLALGMNNRIDQRRISTHKNPTFTDSRATEWISDTRVSGLLMNTQDRDEFMDIALHYSYGALYTDLLAFQVRHPHLTAVKEYTGAYSEYHPIWTYYSVEYTRELEDGTVVPAERCSRIPAGLYLKTDPHWIGITIGYGGEYSDRGIRLFWTRIIVMLAAIWLLLKACLWIGRQLVFRIQRKRVARDQCIFCAYPLSPEALRARSERSGS